MSTYTQIIYQIVFGTKFREHTLSKNNRPELFKYICGILERKNCHVYRINGVEDHIISHFFKLVKDLPKQFLFPMLDYLDFQDSLENGTNFTQEQESQIHRARARHNSALKRESETMRIPNLTGHVPRYTLANQMAYMGNSEEDIRQVLGHSNVATTKIYLRERHGFSGSYDIMKRFHQVK
jgi:integrase